MMLIDQVNGLNWAESEARLRLALTPATPFLLSPSEWLLAHMREQASKGVQNIAQWTAADAEVDSWTIQAAPAAAEPPNNTPRGLLAVADLPTCARLGWR